MVTHNAILYRNMTVIEVLSCLREDHRLAIEVGEADERVTLDLDTSIKQWHHAMGMDHTSPRYVGSGLNIQFGVSLSSQQWRTVLTPARRRKLGELCELIAAEARVPDITPSNILGKRCKLAGAFLALRKMLRKAGCGVEGLRPSTPVREFAVYGMPEIYRTLVRIKPSLQRQVQLKLRHEPVFEGAVLFLASVAFAVFAAAGSWLGLLFPVVFGLFVWTWRKSGKVADLPPRSVTFERIESFRELSLTLISEPC